MGSRRAPLAMTGTIATIHPVLVLQIIRMLLQRGDDVLV
jgi:hypothetical protein